MKKFRERHVLSAQYRDCFTTEEILEYRFGSPPLDKRQHIFNHLNIEKCKRCRKLFLSVKDVGAQEIPPEFSFPIPGALKKANIFRKKLPEPEMLKKGQIWTTFPEIKDANGEIVSRVSLSIPVMVWWQGKGDKTLENVIRVIPISIDIDFHIEPDTLLLEGSASPLGYPILLEAFNERPMPAGYLDKYRGEVSERDLNRLKKLRSQLLEEEPLNMDPEYLVWKQKEVEIAQYLTFPVNAALWEEEGEEKDVEIILQPYRKAADTAGVELYEIKPHVLMETDEFSLSIIQKRDQVLLRHISDTIEPQDVRVDGKPKAMAREKPGTFELLLGEVDVVPGSSELQITLQGEQLTFQLQFKGNNGT